MATSTSAVSVADYDTLGYVSVTWDHTQAATNWYAWRVYRSKRLYDDSGWEAWEMVNQVTVSATSYEYRDYLVPANQQVRYTVVQVTQDATTGALTEDAKDNIRTVTPVGDNYWLVHPIDTTKTTRLVAVTEDSFGRDVEEETLMLIGRGRKKDRGTSWGTSGQLTLEYRDRASRVRLQNLSVEPTHFFLRDPFGEVTKVTIGRMEASRTAGTGTREDGTLSVPYEEVA